MPSTEGETPHDDQVETARRPSASRSASRCRRPWRQGFRLQADDDAEMDGLSLFRGGRQGRQGGGRRARRHLRLCRRRPCRRVAAGRDAAELPDPEARRHHARGDRPQRGRAGAEAGPQEGHRGDDLRRRRGDRRARHVRQPDVLRAGRQDHARLRAAQRAGGRRDRLHRRLADLAEPHGAHQDHDGAHPDRPEIQDVQGRRHPVRRRRRRQELRRLGQPDAGPSEPAGASSRPRRSAPRRRPAPSSRPASRARSSPPASRCRARSRPISRTARRRPSRSGIRPSSAISPPT